jgi:hypothetical protein
MQGTVAPAVAATVAAVAAGPAGGDRDGRGAVGGGEVVGVREAGHRPDLTQDPGGQDGTDADQVDQPGVAGRDQRGQLAGELTDLTVEFAEPHDAAAGESGPHRWLVGEELLGGGQGALGGQPPADQAGQGVLVAIDAAEQLDHLRLVARRWSGGTQACVGVRTTLLSSDAADPAAFEGHSTGKAPTSGKVCGSYPPKAPGILTHR